jgi:hypothetical protein
MQRAGHERFETTQRYVREAENLREGFGAVFPPPPEALFSADEYWSDIGTADLYSSQNPGFAGVVGGADGTRNRRS